jgi:hypothetical protein
MFGSDASQPARVAAELFHREGVKRVLEILACLSGLISLAPGWAWRGPRTFSRGRAGISRR